MYLSTTRNFVRTCDREGLKYQDPYTTDSGKNVVVLGVNGSHGNSYDVKFLFDTDEKSVGVRVYRFSKANRDNFARLLLACNDLNTKYRWLKFCIDDDRDLNIEIDAVIDPSTAGAVCTELFYRIISIAKDAYPVIMKAQFG